MARAHLEFANKLALAGALTVASVALAATNALRKHYAEKKYPPPGKFLTVNGTTLHYIEKGEGPPIVLLHGNGSMVQDWQASGLVDALQKDHRVIAFDRPGYGYTARPGHTVWSPGAQGKLIWEALTQLGAETAILVGHSWGALVALEMSQQESARTSGLILASGYYLPTPRLDAWVASISGTPVLGSFLSHTVLPFLTQVGWPIAIRNLFSPRKVCDDFRELFPKELALRPCQIRTSGKEAFLMMAAAASLPKHFVPSSFPVVFLAGASDKVVDPAHSVELQRRYPGSFVQVLPLQGHMLHHTATDRVVSAISSVSAARRIG